MFVKSKIFDVREQKEKQNQKQNIQEIKDSLSLAEVFIFLKYRKLTLYLTFNVFYVTKFFINFYRPKSHFFILNINQSINQILLNFREWWKS